MADGKVTMPYGRFLGYHKGEDGLSEIVPEKAEVVRLIYKSFMEGMSPYKIAKMLMKMHILTPAGNENWHASTIKSILTNEKYKGSALLQKKFTVDFLTKKQKVNEGEVPQYFVEHSHDGIIDPKEFELVQAEMERRKGLGKEYSGSSIFSAKIVCSCCGGFFGSKVWHSTSKYKRTVWQCNHKFSNGVKCETPHLYEDEIKKRFVEVCNRIATDRDDFLTSCQQIVEMLSKTTALDKKIEAQYIYLNGLTVSMQEFIKENAMEAQDEDFYKKKMAEYNAKKVDMKKVLHDLQDKRAARLSRKELLEGLIQTMSKEGILTDTFDGKLWLLLVEKATVDTNAMILLTLARPQPLVFYAYLQPFLSFVTKINDNSCYR